MLFRLRTINLELQALRKRGSDIEVMAAHAIKTICEANKLPEKTFSSELLAALYAYNWPGNVRELFSTLENVISASGDNSILYPEHLPIAVRAKTIRFSIKPKEKEKIAPVLVPEEPVVNFDSYKKYREQIFHDAEKPYLLHLMSTTDWNIPKACVTSGLSRSRLYELLKKHGVSKANS